MDKEKIKSIIESLLFAWGEPLSINEIIDILNIKKTEAIQLITEMTEEYKADEKRGIFLQQYGDTYQLTTKKENFDYIQKLMQEVTVNRSLSNASLETLSIIAYKQPVTRVEIDIIRGVKSSHIIKGLLEKNLIKEVGKLDKPGKPTLYGTTSEFLKHFGLKTIDELPKIQFEEDEDKKAV